MSYWLSGQIGSLQTGHVSVLVSSGGKHTPHDPHLAQPKFLNSGGWDKSSGLGKGKLVCFLFSAILTSFSLS